MDVMLTIFEKSIEIGFMKSDLIIKQIGMPLLYV